jgi:cystathionine beta-lyase
MELQNISAIVAIAKKHKLISVIDNTWATALRFKPLDIGIDLSIQSATKHISGHSDLVMGVVTGNGDLIDAVGRQAIVMGYCISADDAYLALRGLRSMKIRMDHCEKSARTIAQFLKSRPEVIAVLHPEFDAINAINFKTYFSGGNGVFSFVIDPKFSAKSVHHFIDGMKLFGLGFSWGGYESLIVPQTPNRQHNRNSLGSIVRLSIGFEDTDDLTQDLAAGLDRLHEI